MPKFIIISGSLIVPATDDQKKQTGKKQISLGFGSEVEMSAEEHRAVDPKGDQLITPEAFADLRKAVDAHQAFLAKQKELGAAQVALSPKLISSFARLEAERAAKHSEKPTKKESTK